MTRRDPIVGPLIGPGPVHSPAGPFISARARSFASGPVHLRAGTLVWARGTFFRGPPPSPDVCITMADSAGR